MFALVIEDDPSIRAVLATNLRARGFEVELSGDGTDAISKARAGDHDVFLVDLGLPDIDGSAVIETIRTFSDAPVIVLSVRGEEGDKVRALDAGADDYLTKPFGIDELLARLRAVQRRGGRPEAAEVVRTASFELDLTTKRAEVAGSDVHLTPIEWGLCHQLVTRPGRLVTKRELLRAVWGPEHPSEANYLRVHMGNLRHKLEPDPSRPRYFLTEPGLGYRFRQDDLAEA